MNAFRARLCFGCANRTQSPHKEGASFCSHPDAKAELAAIEAGKFGPMQVSLYAALTVPGGDWPFAYDPIVVDSCNAYSEVEK